MKSQYLKTFLILALVLVSFEIVKIKRQFSSFKNSTTRKLKKYRILEGNNRFLLNKIQFNKFDLPKELKKIPFANDDVILNIKDIEIRNAYAPYNSSLIELGNRYFFCFRYDVVTHMYPNKFNTFIGCAELDKNFEQTEKEFFTLETATKTAEDPRILKLGEELFLIYNDLFSKKSQNRGMYIGKLDSEQGQLNSIQKMDAQPQTTEKNWVPFVHNSSICFEYQLFAPRKILKIDNLDQLNQISSLPDVKDQLKEIPWKKKWGMPRGGTTARLIDGEYLAFFHSSFTDRNNVIWYVMGAYTFESTPPFQVTAVSTHPILFNGIYNSQWKCTAQPGKCVIFPAGYAIENRDGKTLLHLSCGENDCATKIITIDKDALHQTLKKL
ncbi:MAG: hypothetical protein K1000chlam2_00656 [Chlamydiae bacterium]|nr:hypothetical protein [Chlamydiota bacterium]